MPFTSDEIESAVSKLVKTSISRTYGSLGERDIVSTFTDLQESVAGLLMLTQRAPFYVVNLGSRRLLQLLTTFSTGVGTAIALLDALKRPVRADLVLDDLRNGLAALTSLDGALRAKVLSTSISTSAEFTRYMNATHAFLTGPAQDILSGGDVVPTPEEIRQLLPPLLALLKTQYLEIVRVGTSLSTAITDYGNAQIATKIQKTVVRKSKQTLSSHLADLDAAKTPEQKRALLRQVTLDVLASKALVQGVGTFSPLVEEQNLTGLLTPYVDSTHPILPGVITGDKLQPFLLAPGSTTLSFKVDGAPLNVDLSPSFLAQTDSSQAEPYDLHYSTLTSPNNLTLYIQINGVPYTVALTPGSARTALQVCTDINTQLGASGITATPRGSTGKRFIHIEMSSYSLGDTLLFPPSPASQVFSFVENYAWTTGSTTAAQVCTDFNGKQSLVTATTGFVPLHSFTCRTDPSPVGTVQLKGKGQLFTLHGAGLAEMSIVAGSTEVDTRAIRVGDVVQVLNGNNLGSWKVEQIPGPGYMICSSEVTPTVSDVDVFDVIVTTPRGSSSGILDCYLRSAVCTIFKLSGHSVEVMVTDGQSLTDINGQIAQVLVRSGAATGQLLVPLSYVSSDGKSITCSVTSEVEDETLVTVEFIPAVATFVPSGGSVYIESGINRGQYTISSISSSPYDNQGEIVLVERLIQTQEGTPDPLLMTVDVGGASVAFSSTSTTLTNSIELLSSTASSLFFSALTKASATTHWFLVPDGALKMRVGDGAKFYLTDYLNPWVDTEIDALEVTTTQTLASVATALSTTRSWDLSARTVPFARVTDGDFSGYRRFAEGVTAWLVALGPGFFYDLQRLFLPITRTTSPNDEQIALAKAALTSLQDLLLAGASRTPALALDTAILGFVMRPVTEVDVCLRALREKGADRGVDILLEGRFTDFFALDHEDISYAGAMLKLTRTVAREDLPIRKTGRVDRSQQRLLGSADSTDFEYSSEQRDTATTPDSPESP